MEFSFLTKKHCFLLLAVVILLFFSVFSLFVFYSFPFNFLSGGNENFLLLIFLISIYTVYNFGKYFYPKVKTDKLSFLFNSVIVFLFIFVLFWGWFKRPVLFVFEYDRFRVVRYSDVNIKELSKFLSNYHNASYGKPLKVALRPFQSEAEQHKLIFMALNGYSLSFNHNLWQPYEKSYDSIKSEAKKWKNSEKIKNYFINQNINNDDLGFIPVIDNNKYWVASIDLKNAEILNFYSFDPYE
ncbi:hypothetical protein [Comamonas sp. 26]|uniref:hypothetical protein n=1 Tax=Comamonas sp. 26 TaxID=2035201 RepID=UPI0011981F50|nr:hypothetical protein [Comamonas sp. 26]